MSVSTAEAEFSNSCSGRKSLLCQRLHRRRTSFRAPDVAATSVAGGAGGLAVEDELQRLLLIWEFLSSRRQEGECLLQVMSREEGRNNSRPSPPPSSPAATRPDNRRRARIRAPDVAASGVAGEVARFVVGVGHASSRDALQAVVGQVGQGLAVEGELERLLLHRGSPFKPPAGRPRRLHEWRAAAPKRLEAGQATVGLTTGGAAELPPGALVAAGATRGGVRRGHLRRLGEALGQGQRSAEEGQQQDSGSTARCG